MAHKMAEQIKEEMMDEINHILDDFADNATTIPLMCWDTHLTDTANKILVVYKSQIEKDVAKRIFGSIRPIFNAMKRRLPQKEADCYESDLRKVEKKYLGE